MKPTTNSSKPRRILPWWIPSLVTQIPILGFALYLYQSDSSGAPETGYFAVLASVIFWGDIIFILPTTIAIGVIGTVITLNRRRRDKTLKTV